MSLHFDRLFMLKSAPILSLMSFLSGGERWQLNLTCVGVGNSAACSVVITQLGVVRSPLCDPNATGTVKNVRYKCKKGKQKCISQYLN